MAVIVLPVKPFAEGKGRLSPALSPAAREALSRRLYRHVLGVVTAFQPSITCLVVSRSEEVLALARAVGAKTLLETARGGHNSALGQAMEMLDAIGDRPVLIVSTDLPLLTREDIAAMLALDGEAEIGIAPDVAGEGTNALFMARAGLIPTLFGPESRIAHEHAARDAGLRCAIVQRRGLAHDIDTPADLAILPASA
ncbi:2-phospho-L-lactate guanylyltransferase [Sphingobium aquiterrae]|uniref:2-phospho-L-lactate guanylyltransferase n=1 Tax=Sphingobium aquiterrae TaxID=2038656 RepID=UPI0030175717